MNAAVIKTSNRTWHIIIVMNTFGAAVHPQVCCATSKLRLDTTVMTKDKLMDDQCLSRV